MQLSVGELSHYGVIHRVVDRFSCESLDFQRQCGGEGPPAMQLDLGLDLLPLPRAPASGGPERPKPKTGPVPWDGASFAKGTGGYLRRAKQLARLEEVFYASQMELRLGS